MFRLIVFVVVSAGIVFRSWKSLYKWRSHGFFRFFAFEAILVLILLNLGYWFREPFSVLQIISWLLLLASIVLVVLGFYLLHTVGRPEGEFEDTTVLVRRSAYKYIRHPLYSSLLLLTWGVFFKDISLLSASLAIVASGFLVATSRAEEKENLQKFGDDYASYMKTTKMFIPFLF